MPRFHLESASSHSSRDRILAFLSERGGEVRSTDGCNLTAAIANGAGYASITALNAMLARMERDGLIVREVRGKRTYRVALTATAPMLPPRRAVPRRAQAIDGLPVVAHGSAFAQVDIGLPELFSALGGILIAMRDENAELFRRVEALEELVPPDRRPKGQVA
jgi:hypothetical protein